MQRAVDDLGVTERTDKPVSIEPKHNDVYVAMTGGRVADASSQQAELK